MKRTVLYFVAVFMLLMLCSCGQQSKTMENTKEINESGAIQPTPVPEENMEQSLSPEDDAPILICCFQQKEVAVVPEVQEYSYEDAVQKGEVWEIDGMFPAMGTGTWYIIDIDGMEYYYGKDDTSASENYDSEAYLLYGWSIVDDSHELANGIKVGMNESEILKQYPNMVVIDFEGNFIYDKVTGFMGWNGTAYPRSYVGMDSDWNYEGQDYSWTDQFDYIMIADIDLNDVDTLPIYLGLLIKDHVVAAITFYYPTAG